jgi:hypothetical protein
MAKVFHFMLTRVLDRNFLPWREPLTQEMSASEIETGSELMTLPMSTFESCYSLARKADWSIGDSLQIVYEQEETIEHLKMSLTDLMFSLQCIMNDLHYDWFHPDDITLIIRTPDADDFTCEAEMTTDALLSLHVRMTKGSQQAFGFIISRIKDVVLTESVVAAYGTYDYGTVGDDHDDEVVNPNE